MLQPISVVIPTLDEAVALPGCLTALFEVAAGEPIEVVVSDGGSSDGTVAIARAAGVLAIEGQPGRGLQLDRGVKASSGEILLLLHADTNLPPGGLAHIRAALARSGVVAGAFRLGFDETRLRFRIVETLAALRERLFGLPFGDQALFCRRDAYERCGGPPDWPILEDLELARRLKRCGALVHLPDRVCTSSRRYRERGLLSTVVRHQLVLLLFALGVPPARLVGLRG